GCALRAHSLVWSIPTMRLSVSILKKGLALGLWGGLLAVASAQGLRLPGESPSSSIRSSGAPESQAAPVSPAVPVPQAQPAPRSRVAPAPQPAPAPLGA